MLIKTLHKFFLPTVFLLAVLCSGSQSVQAQLATSCTGSGDPEAFSIRIDTVFTDIGEVIGGFTTYDLTGYNTYRLYLVCSAENDLLQAVSGDVNAPTSITTTTSFWQESNLGGATESTINPLLFASFPELEYDSFVSIGLQSAAVTGNGETATTIQEDPLTLPLSGAFEAGQDLVFDSPTGSIWFIADAEASSNAMAGGDLEVMFAQVTTDGTLDGEVLFQVYQNGLQDANTCIRPYLQVNPLNQSGCTDETACNYDPTAFVEDGSCDFCSCPDTLDNQTLSFADDSLGTYFLEWEIYADHDTTEIAELAGMRTYRMYLRTASALDTVSAIFGNSIDPLSIQTTTSFYHNGSGGPTPSAINPILYDFVDALPYDSWGTIGIESSPDQPPYLGLGYTTVSPLGAWTSGFEAGGGC